MVLLKWSYIYVNLLWLLCFAQTRKGLKEKLKPVRADIKSNIRTTMFTTETESLLFIHYFQVILWKT